MGEKLTALSFNAKTGESVERELTADELAQVAATQESFLAEQSALTAKIAARESALAKLAKLGLTQAEIDAL
jgi:hypothetical protein